MKALRVLIVGENATNQYGGEAILPLHYFRLLNDAGVETYLVTHDRVKQDLLSNHNLVHDNIYYIEDNALFKLLHYLSTLLPPRLAWLSFGSMIYMLHSVYQWFLIKKLIKKHGVNVVHQPTPVSPKLPSGVFGLGVPVVIGPMNGGMHFPPAFEYMAGRGELITFKWLRVFADGAKWFVPGKRLASILLVANMRTKEMLTHSEQLKTKILPENGVLSVEDNLQDHAGETVNCLFVGRLVDWKAIDLLIEAIALCQHPHIQLTIVGSGEDEQALKALVETKQLTNVNFTGFVKFDLVNHYYRSSDIFVLPSLRECGGAVVLEAMAHGLPVIATKWGGPVEYVTPETGILIPPDSRASLIEGISTQIDHLAYAPALRKKMGLAAIERVKSHYMWEDKVNQMIKIYHELV